MVAGFCLWNFLPLSRFMLSETHFKSCLEMKLFDAHLEACPRDALQKRSVS